MTSPLQNSRQQQLTLSGCGVCVVRCGFDEWYGHEPGKSSVRPQQTDIEATKTEEEEDEDDG